MWKKSIDLLAYTLIEIPHQMLTYEQITALTTFFIEKLQDVICVLPAVKSLFALLHFHSSVIKNVTGQNDVLQRVFTGLSHENFHVPAYN